MKRKTFVTILGTYLVTGAICFGSWLVWSHYYGTHDLKGYVCFDVLLLVFVMIFFFIICIGQPCIEDEDEIAN